MSLANARTEPFQSPSTLFTGCGYSAGDTRTKGVTSRRFLGLAALTAVVALVFGWRGAGGGAGGDHRSGQLVGPATATATGTGEPERAGDDLVRRIRDEHELRLEDRSPRAPERELDTAVSASLTGLASGTTYHYRVVATNSSGTGRGADGIFTTSSAPVAVTGPATSVTPTSATLNGTVDPNGRETTWYFEYGTSTSYGSKTAEKNAGPARAP